MKNLFSLILVFATILIISCINQAELPSMVNNTNEEKTSSEFDIALDLIKGFDNRGQTVRPKSLDLSDLTVLRVEESIYTFDLDGLLP